MHKNSVLSFCWECCLRHPWLVVLCCKSESLPSVKAQARDKVHSSFRSLSSAINTGSGDYLLESANKLFGEKSARFKEVSYASNWNRCFPKPQRGQFQNNSLWVLGAQPELLAGSPRTASLTTSVPLLCQFLPFLLKMLHMHSSRSEE